MFLLVLMESKLKVERYMSVDSGWGIWFIETYVLF